MGRKVLFLIISLMLCLSAAFAATEYEFKIKIDHTFSDDEVTCELVYDDDEDTLTFDEDSDDDDLEIVETFTEYVEFDCDERLETMRLYIYDEDDERIFRETYEDEDDFEYELDLVDEDDKWFEFEIDDDFESVIDCELRIDDDDEYDFTFDKDSPSDDKTFSYNYEDEFTLECEDELDEVELRVYDDVGEEEFDETYYDTDLIEFDKEDLLAKNELRIEIDHSFKSDEEIDCELTIDDNDDYEYTLDDSSSSDDLLIVKSFRDIFSFECDDKLDEITLRIYDDEGDKIDSLDFDDEDEIEYELNQGTYEFLVEIEHDFDEDVDCDLYIDDRDKEKLSFDESSDRSDKRIEDDFNRNITLECEDSLDSVEIYVFESDDNHDGDLLDQFTYKLKSVIDLKYKYEEEEKQEEDEEEEEEKEEDDTTQSSSNQPQEQNITQNLNEDNLITDDNMNGNDTLNVTSEEILKNQSEVNQTNQSGIIKDSPEGMKSLGVALFILFLIVVVVVLFLGALKTKEQSRKRKPTHKHKVDLEYLKKRK